MRCVQYVHVDNNIYHASFDPTEDLKALHGLVLNRRHKTEIANERAPIAHLQHRVPLLDPLSLL